MRSTWPSRLLALAATSLLALSAHGELSSVDEVEDCVRDNQPKSSVQTLQMKAIDRMGAAVISRAEIHQKKFDEGSRGLLRFSNPPKLRGSSVLIIGKDDRADLFVYLPELQRVRRVNKHGVSGSMFGTDFSYEDFERLRGFTEDESTNLLDSQTLEGRAVYVIEGRPAYGEDSRYVRVVSHIDKKTCVPLRTEFYEKNDRLRKILTAEISEITQEGSSHIPRLLLMVDQVDETRTELRVEEIDTKARIPRKLFSQRELERAGR